MIPHTRLLITLPLLLVGACASDQDRSVRLLDQRLQTRLASDIAANRVAVQSLPDGVRITLLDPAPFQAGTTALEDSENDIRSSVVQGLLDPDLMRVQVADTGALPDRQRAARVQSVVQYFADYGLAGTLLPAEPLAPGSAAATPAGVAITISVVCPHRTEGGFYDTGQRIPGCD